MSTYTFVALLEEITYIQAENYILDKLHLTFVISFAFSMRRGKFENSNESKEIEMKENSKINLSTNNLNELKGMAKETSTFNSFAMIIYKLS